MGRKEGLVRWMPPTSDRSSGVNQHYLMLILTNSAVFLFQFHYPDPLLFPRLNHPPLVNGGLEKQVPSSPIRTLWWSVGLKYNSRSSSFIMYKFRICCTLLARWKKGVSSKETKRNSIVKTIVQFLLFSISFCISFNEKFKIC